MVETRDSGETVEKAMTEPLSRLQLEAIAATCGAGGHPETDLTTVCDTALAYLDRAEAAKHMNIALADRALRTEARMAELETERDESRNVEDQALARARVAESGLRRLRESYDKLASEREALLTIHNQELEHYRAVLPKLSAAEARADAAESALGACVEALRAMLSIPIGPCDPKTAFMVLEVNTPIYEQARLALADTAAAGAQRDERLRREAADPAYHERNQVVSALSKLYPSVIGFDPKEPDWPVVFITLPTGQVSWHITVDERHSIFAHIYDESGKWDGHDDAEKFRRLRDLPVEPGR